MKKINIAELLKHCPTGMELDSTIVDELYFDEITENNMIKCYTKQRNEFTSFCNFIYFYFDGSYIDNINAKCVIFPKGKTTWKGFQRPQRPFKDGDIIYNPGIKATAIFYKQTNDHTISHCFLNILGELKINHYHSKILLDWRFATLEEKERLFMVIRDNGYKWDPEIKTLEKLPKFNVGDVIQYEDGYKVKITEVNIEDECYGYESIIAKGIGSINFSEQDKWKLIPSKFDINTLNPFDKVLVRTNNFAPAWTTAFYDGYNPNIGGCFRPFGVSGGQYFQQCIPYEGNEHLRGTTNECSEYYKNWE